MQSLSKLFDDIRRLVEDKYREYSDELRRAQESWNAYQSIVNKIKRNWDFDEAMLHSRLDQMRREIDELRKQMELLAAQKDIGLIDEDAFAKSSAELNEIMTSLSKTYEDLSSKLEELSSLVTDHWLRSIDITKTSLEQIDNMLKEVEDAKARSELSDEVYRRLKREAEMLRKAVQAFSMLREAPSDGDEEEEKKKDGSAQL